MKKTVGVPQYRGQDREAAEHSRDEPHEAEHENNILKHTYISAQSQDNSNDILLNYRKPEYRKFRKFGRLAWVHDEVVTFQKERNNFTKRFRLKTSVCF